MAQPWAGDARGAKASSGSLSRTDSFPWISARVGQGRAGHGSPGEAAPNSLTVLSAQEAVQCPADESQFGMAQRDFTGCFHLHALCQNVSPSSSSPHNLSVEKIPTQDPPIIISF